MSAEWIVLPVVGALIGWLTNAIAVRMLFRPRRPRRILGITWVGLLPKRKADLARRVAQVVEEQLFSADDVQKLLDDPALETRLLELVGERVDAATGRLLDRLPPMVRMFVPTDRLGVIRAAVMEEVIEQLPVLRRELAAHLDRALDVKRTVEERIVGFDIEKLERITYDIARRELVHIERLGGVLGALIGLLQAAALPALRAIPGF